jgi:hypothetical protein
MDTVPARHGGQYRRVQSPSHLRGLGSSSCKARADPKACVASESRSRSIPRSPCAGPMRQASSTRCVRLARLVPRRRYPTTPSARCDFVVVCGVVACCASECGRNQHRAQRTLARLSEVMPRPQSESHHAPARLPYRACAAQPSESDAGTVPDSLPQACPVRASRCSGGGVGGWLGPGWGGGRPAEPKQCRHPPTTPPPPLARHLPQLGSGWWPGCGPAAALARAGRRNCGARMRDSSSTSADSPPAHSLHGMQQLQPQPSPEGCALALPSLPAYPPT